MKRSFSWILAGFLGFSSISLEAFVLHQGSVRNEWREENLPPFDELMISWNAARPAKGRYLFYVSAKLEAWSPWFLYAVWGSEGQSSFLSELEESSIRVYQDALEVLEGKKATGFQMRVVLDGDASLEDLHSLHVYINSDRSEKSFQETSYSHPIYLQVAGLSQMILHHDRYDDLCSPTSTAAVLRYLSSNKGIDPVEFAERVWDNGFDIFGNWVFNVAEAFTELGQEWSCWVERFNSFHEIYQKLDQGIPVIVSVKGPLVGSFLYYTGGHLMAVIGYDPDNQRVICMDPAAPSDEEAHISYALSDFLQAWSGRGRVVYVFNKN